MPVYLFKCNLCKTETEVSMTIGQHESKHDNPDHLMGQCSNKKCKESLYRENQIINFQGAINMNNDIKAKAYRKYNNKQGGPVGLSGNKQIGKAKI